MNKNKLLLACVGDSNKISTFSNIPYYILKTGIRLNLFNTSSGLALRPEKLFKEKILWNLSRYLKGTRHGGFQYSEKFARDLMQQVNIPYRSEILSLQPMLPAWPWPKDWKVYLYIDVTTKQNFEHYGIKKRLSKNIQRQALLQEKNACLHAEKIICMTNWCANSLIKEHEISPDKISVVLPGANLDETKLDFPIKGPYPQKPTKNNPLKLGFLGKDWIRKGGPFLIELAKELNSLKIFTVIRVIGPPQEKIPKYNFVNYLGKIDKTKNFSKFINELQSWHFGTLFSKAEGFGISNRECMILGVPVLANDVGGIPEAFPFDECGKLFSPDCSAKEVANWIRLNIQNYNIYLEKREKLSLKWQEFTWTTAVEKISQIIKS